jgi:hypothetical protein
MSSYLVLAGVLVTFLTAVLGFLATRQKIGEVEHKAEEIHVLVNSQLQAVVARVSQLIDALEHAGVAVPPNKNGAGGSGDTPAP